MRRLSLLLATVCGAGYAPVAPGTVGSLVALPLVWVVHRFSSTWVDVASIVVVFLAGSWAAGEAERIFRLEDPGPVVIDEVLGMLVTLALMPFEAWTALAGFFIFRVFDVIKPFPARQLERLHGGLGIMSDDLMAGLYSNAALRVLVWAWPSTMRLS